MRKRPNKSLHLNRETLRGLTSDRALRAVQGGESLFCVPPTNQSSPAETCVCEWNND